MSSWIVPNATIDALVTTGLGFRDTARGPLTWAHGGRTFVLTETTAPDVALMLAEANWQSVRYRYPNLEDDDLPHDDPASSSPHGRYRYRPAIAETLSMISIAVRCYVYQSCATPAWHGSGAEAFCTALTERVQALGPKTAPALGGWPLTEADVLRPTALESAIAIVNRFTEPPAGRSFVSPFSGS